MSTGSRTTRELEQDMNDQLGDEVILKLHIGDPGPDLTDNLVDGTGYPTIMTRTNTRPIQFKATHQADNTGASRDYYVSVWRDDKALFLLDPDGRMGEPRMTLLPGDTITVGGFPTFTLTGLAD